MSVAPAVAAFKERPADGAAAGLLVLHHGRGTDESDLLTLGEVLDPQHRLHVVTPRAPLLLADSPGFYWYRVRSVGYPDPETFALGFAALADFHDQLWQRTGIGPERTVLGGFSMGSVISYSLGLAAERPAPAGIMAFSGFLPDVDGWEPDLASRRGLPVFIAHGRQDAVISVELGRGGRQRPAPWGL
jgi:phospholipase/carboxylesterase